MGLTGLKIHELGSIYKMFSLAGKKAIVTGASGGIGRSTANAFAEMGADVALMDIPAKEKDLKEYADFIAEKHGVKTLVLTGDVSKEDSVNSFIDKMVDEFGTIDIVHDNAGIACGDAGSDISMKDWEKSLGVNLTGVLLVARAAANVMKKHGHGGSIIMTASMSGHIINIQPRGGRYVPSYPATKAAVIHLAKSMAMDYVEDNIRVNSISPGIILSGFHDGWPEDFFKEAVEPVPMRRFGTLDEIVGVVAFLASDLASYATGSDFLVDGGYTCW